MHEYTNFKFPNQYIIIQSDFGCYCMMNPVIEPQDTNYHSTSHAQKYFSRKSFSDAWRYVLHAHDIFTFFQMCFKYDGLIRCFYNFFFFQLRVKRCLRHLHGNITASKTDIKVTRKSLLPTYSVFFWRNWMG